MKRILYITLKDLQENLRERTTFLFLLIMPVAFTLLFGVAFGGFGGSKVPKDTRLPVGYLDQDGSRISEALKGYLDQSEVIRLDETAAKDTPEMEKLLASDKLAAALIVPAGYGASIEAGQPLKLTMIADPGSPNAMKAQAAVQTAASHVASAAAIARIVAPDGGTAYDAVLTTSLTAWQQPPLRLAITAPTKGTGSTGMDLTQFSPGMMIQFAIAGLLTAAQVLVGERKSRCMQRLLTTSTSRLEILLGHYLAIFTLIMVQLALLILFGQLLLKLDYLRQPLATLIMAVAVSLVVAALGLLIGALAKTDEQAIIFAMIPMFVFSGLGGAWMPLENTGKAFQAIGHLTPVAWAMDGFKAIIARGLDLNAIWLPAAVLLGYALLFGSLAVWKFRYE
jgi:ABC-2 type transport system permease protein